MRKSIYFLLATAVLFSCKNNEATNKKIYESELLAYANPPALYTFKHVADIQDQIAKEYNTEFVEWSNSHSKLWRSHTPINRFGTHSKNGSQNDINFVLYGVEEDNINQIDIVLNIYNVEETEEALQKLREYATNTLRMSAITLPEELKDNFTDQKSIYYENDDAYITLRRYVRRGKNLNISQYEKLDEYEEYYSWVFRIKSK